MELTFENIKKIAKDTLDFQVEFIFLVGSAATPRFNSESDIDLAVYWKESVTDFEAQKLWMELESKINRDIELIAINKADIIFKRQVLETGRLLLCHNDGLLLQWKMEVLSEYPDFKRSRKIIEENILTRKKYV